MHERETTTCTRSDARTRAAFDSTHQAPVVAVRPQRHECFVAACYRRRTLSCNTGHKLRDQPELSHFRIILKCRAEHQNLGSVRRVVLNGMTTGVIGVRLSGSLKLG